MARSMMVKSVVVGQLLLAALVVAVAPGGRLGGAPATVLAGEPWGLGSCPPSGG